MKNKKNIINMILFSFLAAGVLSATNQNSRAVVSEKVVLRGQGDAPQINQNDIVYAKELNGSKLNMMIIQPDGIITYKVPPDARTEIYVSSFRESFQDKEINYEGTIGDLKNSLNIKNPNYYTFFNEDLRELLDETKLSDIYNTVIYFKINKTSR